MSQVVTRSMILSRGVPIVVVTFLGSYVLSVFLEDRTNALKNAKKQTSAEQGKILDKELGKMKDRIGDLSDYEMIRPKRPGEK